MANEKPLKINGTTGKVQRFESGDYVVVGNGGTGLTTVPANAILYASALDTLAALTAGTNGHVLSMVSGSPAWAAPATAAAADKVFRAANFC